MTGNSKFLLKASLFRARGGQNNTLYSFKVNPDFAYWGFSGESGTAYNYLCVYVYDKRLNCIPYYSGTKRVSPIDEIKAWDRYFAIVPGGSEEVVVYEVE